MSDNSKCSGNPKTGADYAERCRTSKANSQRVDPPVPAKPEPVRLNRTPNPTGYKGLK